MKIYADPISTTCRPVLLFIADTGAPVEFHLIQLMKGEHMQPEFIAIKDRCLKLLHASAPAQEAA